MIHRSIDIANIKKVLETINLFFFERLIVFSGSMKKRKTFD